MHSVARFSFLPLGVLAAAGLFIFSLASFENTYAQNASAPGSATPAIPASATVDALTTLQSTFPEVMNAVNGVDLRKWKVPSDVKNTASADIQSIVRDLNGTLPNLLGQAQAAPGTVAPVFAVYRNLDALYDVLLRVTETATLAGSQQEASRLESARADLQIRRSQLGNALLTSATAQDANVVMLQSTIAAARQGAATAATGPKKIVVTDGPDTATAKTHKKKPVAKPAVPASSSEPSSPQQ